MKQQQISERDEYLKNVKKRMPKSNLISDLAKAFLVGGLFCVLGQGIHDWGLAIGITEKEINIFSSIILVFIGATLTGIGVYDKLGTFSGAGSIVPITGFANSIVSPAMEFRREGLVLGVGAKLFSIAGPVLVYGISSSIIVGLLALVFS